MRLKHFRSDCSWPTTPLHHYLHSQHQLHQTRIHAQNNYYVPTFGKLLEVECLAANYLINHTFQAPPHSGKFFLKLVVNSKNKIRLQKLDKSLHLRMTILFVSWTHTHARAQAPLPLTIGVGVYSYITYCSGPTLLGQSPTLVTGGLSTYSGLCF